jgi:hypothetical protein
VKRRDVERHLREPGARLLREGGSHSVWGFDAERSSAALENCRVEVQVSLHAPNAVAAMGRGYGAALTCLGSGSVAVTAVPESEESMVRCPSRMSTRSRIPMMPKP